MVDPIQPSDCRCLRIVSTELWPRPFLLCNIVNGKEQYLRIGSRGHIFLGGHRRSNDQRGTGLSPSGEVVKIVVLAESVDRIRTFCLGPGEHNRYPSAHFLRQSHAAGAIVVVWLAVESEAIGAHS